MSVKVMEEEKEKRELIVEDNCRPTTAWWRGTFSQMSRRYAFTHSAPPRQAHTSKGNASIEANKTLRHCLPTTSAYATCYCYCFRTLKGAGTGR